MFKRLVLKLHRGRSSGIKTLVFLIACTTVIAAQTNPFLGEIRMFAGNFAPTGWALCDGSLFQISQNQALFSLLGTTYGGNGTTTFALPDFRGRMPIDAGTGTGLTARTQGDIGGQESVTLTLAQMPVHSHTATIMADSTVGTSDRPNGAVPARNGAAVPSFSATVNTSLKSTAVTIGTSGSGQPHPIMPPYTCVTFIIALQGIFPARN